MGKKRPVQPGEQPKQTKKHKISKKTQEKSESKNPQTEKQPIKEKRKTQKTSQFVFFSPAFYQKLNAFTDLYRQFLTIKSSAQDKNIGTELYEVTKKVREHIQDEASSIFKHQLQETQAWIRSQIQKVDEEVKVIETAYQNNRESLLKTGAFSQDQVKKQLAPIQAKVVVKKGTRQKFQNLLSRSRQIYE